MTLKVSHISVNGNLRLLLLLPTQSTTSVATLSETPKARIREVTKVIMAKTIVYILRSDTMQKES